VFDVNETLLDMAALDPIFERASSLNSISTSTATIPTIEA